MITARRELNFSVSILPAAAAALGQIVESRSEPSMYSPQAHLHRYTNVQT